ncbi:hypothetical protein AB0K15_30935 [Amycolatopsis sp. NPDC049253]|uniref:hypothetical protein n=1 Tax=Amycolatopsis sp. NPDC049253 TaxID=3155274 RepID=UPI00343E5E3C
MITKWRARPLILIGTTVLLTVSFISSGAAQASNDSEVLKQITLDNSSAGRLADTLKQDAAGFGGIYFDKKSQRYVITTPSIDKFDAIAKKVQSISSSTQTVQQFPVEVKTAKHSSADLNAIVDKLRDPANELRLRLGDTLTDWGIVASDNKVRLDVTRLDTSIVDFADQRYGDAVEFRATDANRVATRTDKVNSVVRVATTKTTSATKAAKLDAAPDRFLDGVPYWAGDRIGYYSNGVVTQCTSGFVAQAGMFTAGHCFDQNVTVEQGYVSGGTFYTTGNMGAVTARAWGNNQTDAESIDPNASNPPGYVAPAVYVTDNDALPEHAISSTISGSSFCTDGSFTGENCSGIIDIVQGCALIENFTVCGIDTGYSSNGSRLVQHGDSGGPVEVHDTTGGLIVLGVISAGNVGDETNPGPGNNVLFSDAQFVCQINVC